MNYLDFVKLYDIVLETSAGLRELDKLSDGRHWYILNGKMYNPTKYGWMVFKIRQVN